VWHPSFLPIFVAKYKESGTALKNFFYGRLTLLIISIICFAGAEFSDRIADDHAATLSKFQNILHQKEIILEAEVDSLALKAEHLTSSQLFEQETGNYSQLFEKEGIILLVYQNDTLNYWTDNSMSVENYIRQVCLDDRITQLSNGWFEVMRKPSSPQGTHVVIGLLLLKKEYPYQNQYLVNEFGKDYNLNKDIQLVRLDTSSNNQVRTHDNHYLCSLTFPEVEVDDTAGNAFLISLLNILAFLFAILYLRAECNSFSKNTGPYVASLLFAVSVLLLRFVTILAHFPQSFYEMPVFGPQYYGDASSFWLSSLGDLFINATVLFFITWYAYRKCPVDAGVLKKFRFPKSPFAFLLLFGILWLSRELNLLFIGLIQNSNISFDINNLFSLDAYSFMAIFIIGLLLFSFFLAADKVVDVVRGFGIPDRQQLLLFLIAIGAYSFVSHLLSTRDLIMVLWPVALLFFISYTKRNSSSYVFSSVVLLVSLFSFYAVHTLTKYREQKELNNRTIFAEKLAAEQDPLAEHLFTEVEEKIKQDSTLMVKATFQSDDFGKDFIAKYFSGYWEKYDVRVSMFDTMCFPLFNGSNPNRDNHEFFEEEIRKAGNITESKDCYYLNDSSGKISYISRIPLYSGFFSTTRIGDLYIELDSRFVSEEIGFPELLLDREIGLNRTLVNYSYAKYKHGSLINKFGKFPYSLVSTQFPGKTDTVIVMESEGSSHVIYRPDKETLVVLSKKSEGALGSVTTFSYLFAFFSLLLLFILMVRQLSLGIRFSQISFKYRIQLLLVMIVLVSLVLFGGGTIYYIQRQYEEKNMDIISEKTQSVLTEVESKLGNELSMTNNYMEYASYILKKYSNVFFTDINLYDTRGNLFASSRPKVFDEGLTSKKMNPVAYLNIGIGEKTEFIHDENIGKLYYLSAYVPVKNKEGKLVAFLNLPYFAKQSDLEKEISTFLVALINIYVLLFGLSIIVAIFISNYLTRPLKLIQEKLGKIKLGKMNEPIEWKQNDEIGSLVNEYNRMILELQNSAQLLARSERESAWREMAKQVAHEIKNPLTPMKLSIQHMERLINDGSPNLEEKIKRLAKTLIEQIETLSSIATEFSNFAKMPKANNEAIHIKEAVENSIRLFKTSDESEVKFTTDLDNAVLVYADKEQLIRIFNNLIKNAIQAIPEGQKGLIEVGLFRNKDMVVVSVKDNGTGIDDEVVDKIFVPNFTTKTTGMGLGLAMVKNIVEGCGGRIWFETAKDKGSTFYVALPEYKEDLKV
jgi:two-component system nitrogen regulation sensor histidine kinase NtrY